MKPLLDRFEAACASLVPKRRRHLPNVGSDVDRVFRDLLLEHDVPILDYAWPAKAEDLRRVAQLIWSLDRSGRMICLDALLPRLPRIRGADRLTNRSRPHWERLAFEFAMKSAVYGRQRVDLILPHRETYRTRLAEELGEGIVVYVAARRPGGWHAGWPDDAGVHVL